MQSNEGIITAFTRNASYIHTHCEGLSHAQSLMQPPVQGNCINWIVGHIVSYRNFVMALMNEAPVSSAADVRYAKGTPPVLADGPGVMKLADLLGLYDSSEERLFASIRRMTAQQADEVVTQGDFTLRRTDMLVHWMRHESYHAGNLEWLSAWVRK